MTTAWVVVLLFTIPSIVFGACPNKCSGHGKCGLNDVCQCMQNWIGGDCSGRQCSFTRAWQDTAHMNNDAHYYAECGNRGTCDRSTGECTCDDGFVGSGCRRMQCPNDCSGHGTCEFIEELAGDSFHKRIGGTAATTYQLWDQEKIMGCVCDGGYEGHDCSLRTCPKGDDPLTPTQADMVQAIVINQAGGSGYLTYFDPYGNVYTTEIITFGAALGTDDDTTCENIETALHRLPNNVLNNVQVSIGARFYAFSRIDPKDPKGYGTVTPIHYNDGTANGAQDKVICEITFNSEPGTTGYQNLFACNVADHTAVGHHPVGGTSTDSCDVYEVYTDQDVDLANIIAATTILERPLTELTECSGRGTCDYDTGTCTCFAGHMGLACQKQEALV